MNTNNTLRTDRLSYDSENMAPTRLHLFSYNDNDIDEHIENDLQILIPETERPDYIHWLQICGLQNTSDIQNICTHFGINFLVMQDILNPNHPCKIEEYEKFNIVIAKYFDKEKESQVSIVQGENFILTFMEFENPNPRLRLSAYRFTKRSGNKFHFGIGTNRQQPRRSGIGTSA